LLDDLVAAVRIPSISSAADHVRDVRDCAEHMAEHLRAIGIQRVEVLPTAGHPVLYGEWLEAPGAPTTLVYGHYDVQPVDPLEEWETPPFDPQVRDGLLFGRGAVDDKGQVYMHFAALEAFLATRGRLPLNLKLLVEGEEEIGSPHLAAFVADHRSLLAADVGVISDTPMYSADHPSLCYGLRGLAYLQVEVDGPATDLHSGTWGGIVPNPALGLASMLAGLKDSRGKITLRGFYDAVRPLTDEERAMLGALPFDPGRIAAELGVEQLVGEADYTPLERLWARPTLDVHGVWGGFSGSGAKTVIPARAGAKLSCRLVPDQDPERISALVAEHLERVAPPGLRVRVTPLHGGRPVLTPLEHPALRAAGRAVGQAFGKAPVFIREGGSIPFVATLVEELRIPCVLLGVGLPDERTHAPNEFFHLENYYRGMRAVAYLWEELGRPGALEKRRPRRARASARRCPSPAGRGWERSPTARSPRT
jgi:acetylornithine deacetylase/succinyl-diaminopimelate desuccinylase-like protein